MDQLFKAQAAASVMSWFSLRKIRLFLIIVSQSFLFGIVFILVTKDNVKMAKKPDKIVNMTYKGTPLIVSENKTNQVRENLQPTAEEWLSRKKYQIPHVSPEEYRGAKLESWPPQKSRNVSIYVRPEIDNFILRPNRNTLTNCKVLLVVHSTLSDFDVRVGIRNTWLTFENLKESGISTIFLVGKMSTHQNDLKDPNHNPLQRRLIIEQQKYGDILQADMIENYHNLTLKSMFTLKFFLNESNFGGNSVPRYLFKVDEDTFLNLPNLWKTIDTWEPRDNSRFIIGSVLGTLKKPVRPVKMPNIKNRKQPELLKWWCPTYMFNGKTYPIFVSGSGYIITRDASKCIYEAGLRLPYFHLEDVFITGFAAEWCSVARVHSKNFESQYPKIEMFDVDSDLLYHYISTKTKKHMFKIFSYDFIKAKLEKLLLTSNHSVTG